MDKESISTAASYQRMWEDHFNGGFYSSKVREEATKLVDASDAEKNDFFKSVFSRAYSLAEALQKHPRFMTENGTAGTFDLSLEGLGTITIDANVMPANEEEGIREPCRTLYVIVNSYDPIPEAEEVWVGDTLEATPRVSHRQKTPKFWDEPVFAKMDGQVEDYFRDNLDGEILRLLDCYETLEVIQEVIN